MHVHQLLFHFLPLQLQLGDAKEHPAPKSCQIHDQPRLCEAVAYKDILNLNEDQFQIQKINFHDMRML